MQLAPHNQELLEALRARDLAAVTRLVDAHPELVAAPSGDPAHGELLAMAAQTGDTALVRLAFERAVEPDVQLALARACRSPVARYRKVCEFLMARGANPRGNYGADQRPVIFVACENLQPDVLQMLLECGADPEEEHRPPEGDAITPLEMLTRALIRDPAGLHGCIDVLSKHGVAVVDSPVMSIYRGDEAGVQRHLDADPTLLEKHFDVPCANTPLHGVTLLHIAAEFCEPEIARLLLERGADLNARAAVDEDGFGGQTPIFHTVNSIWNRAFRVFKLLIESGADVTMGVNLKHGAFGMEVRDATPLDYAMLVPRGGAPHPEVVDVLKLVGKES